MNFIPKDPNFKERVAEKFALNKLSHLVGISLTHVEAGEVIAEVEITDKLSQQDNIAHGGLTLTLADVAAGFAAYTLLPAHQRVVTAELKNSFLRPGKGEKLIGIGKVIKAGKSMLFCESEIFAQDGERRTLIAKATTIMAVIDLPNAK